MKTPDLHPKDLIAAAVRVTLPSLIAIGLVACGGGSSSASNSSASAGSSSSSAIAAAGVEYSLTDIGGLSSSHYTVGYAINASGQITGYSQVGNQQYDAFLYSDGTMTDLGDFTYSGLATGSVGDAINDSGEVVGWADVPGGVDAFLYTAGAMVDLGPFFGADSKAYGINSSGEIIGYSSSQESWIYYNGAVQALGTLDAVIPSQCQSSCGSTNPASYYLSQLVAINGVQMAGNISTATVGETMAILYNGNTGTLTQLGTLGGLSSTATAINADGVVVGYYLTANGTTDAFLISGAGSGSVGSIVDLGSNSEALGINSSEEVVGIEGVGGSSGYPFLYKNGTMFDLSSLVDPSDPLAPYVTLANPVGINDNGQIVATGTDSQDNDIEHTYLLTPAQ